jgi:protocatechuate 3,4-dioxygenase beta subunit
MEKRRSDRRHMHAGTLLSCIVLSLTSALLCAEGKTGQVAHSNQAAVGARPTRAVNSDTSVSQIKVTQDAIVEVLVKDRDGKPVAQAEVALRRVGDRLISMQQTDENGLLRVRVRPGEYELFGAYETPFGGKGSRREGQFAVAEGETKRIEYVPGFSLKIPAVAGIAAVTGIVRDEAGDLLAGVEIQVLPMPTVSRDEIRSDASGRFEIPPDPRIRPPRNMTRIVVARDVAHNLAASANVEQPGRALDLKLQPGLTITGTVLSEEGRPLAGSRVQVWLEGPRWRSFLNLTEPITTASDGSFEVKTLPTDRQYTIAATADGYGRRSVAVNPEDSKDHRYDAGRLKLPLAKFSLAGVVVDPDGKPVAEALINASGEGQPDRLHAWTDAEGRFMIQGVCPGPIRLTASSREPTSMRGTAQAEGGATGLRIVVYRFPAARAAPAGKPTALKAKPLPPLTDLGIDLPAEAEGKMLLVCFWDMNERPSRNCITQLATQASQIAEKGVLIVAVHAAKVDGGVLSRWLKDNRVPFTRGMIVGDIEKARLAWGATSLPHLILTDKKHTVVAEGFGLDDLDKQIETAGR